MKGKKFPQTAKERVPVVSFQKFSWIFGSFHDQTAVDINSRSNSKRENESLLILDCKLNPSCNFKYDPVCGSDGITYLNQCSLDFFICENKKQGKELFLRCEESCPCGVLTLHLFVSFERHSRHQQILPGIISQLAGKSEFPTRSLFVNTLCGCGVLWQWLKRNQSGIPSPVFLHVNMRTNIKRTKIIQAANRWNILWQFC